MKYEKNVKYANMKEADAIYNESNFYIDNYSNDDALDI